MNTFATEKAGIFPKSQKGYEATKRFLDLAICLMILPLVLAVMAVILVCTLLESPGPILFLQERVGRGGRRFHIYKFRTMKHDFREDRSREFLKAYVKGQIGGEDSDARPAVYKPNHQAGITRMGRILRKTSLDELPQIFNVLMGEMSLVGPRPHIVCEVEEYQDWHRQRLEVLPGITGLAQVNGRSSLPFDRMVYYDLKYVQERGLKLDLKILWWTFLSVLKTRGAG